MAGVDLIRAPRGEGEPRWQAGRCQDDGTRDKTTRLGLARLTPDSIGATSSQRRKRSVDLSLLPCWGRVCPSGRPLVESLSSRAPSAREAWVRQRSRAWVRQRSQAWVRPRSRTMRLATEHREFMAESPRQPLAASVGAPTVASVGAPTVVSVGAPTVAPRPLSRNSNAGPTPANARISGWR